MELIGEEFVPQSTEQVWAALTDPDVLRRCIPGCASLVQENHGSFSLEVIFRIGPAEPRFRGRMTIENPDYPNSYTLKAFGKDGGASDAVGQAELFLHAVPGSPDSTRLGYRMKMGIRGSLAHLGEKLIHLAARRMTQVFFRRFLQIVQPAADTAEGQGAAEEVEQIIAQALRGGDWQS